MIDITRVLSSLTPNAQWIVRGDKVVWLDEEQDQPTQEEIVQKIAELEYLQEVEEYKAERELAYPPTGEQFDKIFHEGIDAWKADIQAVKDAYPKAVIDNDTLEARKSQALFDKKLADYTTAIERLAQYQLSVGKPAVTEQQSKNVHTEDSEGNLVFDDDLNPVYETVEETVTIEPAVEPLVHEREVVEGIPSIDIRTSTLNENGEVEISPVEYQNPLIVRDDAERAEAQAVVDATPQAVIDAYEA